MPTNQQYQTTMGASPSPRPFQPPMGVPGGTPGGMLPGGGHFGMQPPGGHPGFAPKPPPFQMPTGADDITQTLFDAGNDDKIKKDYFNSFGLDHKGRNEAASGIKMLTPLEYGMLAHQYGFYQHLQPEQQQAIQEAVDMLKDPHASNLALRHGLLSRAPDTANQMIGQLRAMGAGPSAQAGAVVNATNDANRTANASEAADASPAGRLSRLQALHSVIESAQPDIQRLMSMGQFLGSLPQQAPFLGQLAGAVTSALPLIPGLGGAGAAAGAATGSQAATAGAMGAGMGQVHWHF